MSFKTFRVKAEGRNHWIGDLYDISLEDKKGDFRKGSNNNIFPKLKLSPDTKIKADAIKFIEHPRAKIFSKQSTKRKEKSNTLQGCLNGEAKLFWLLTVKIEVKLDDSNENFEEDFNCNRNFEFKKGTEKLEDLMILKDDFQEIILKEGENIEEMFVVVAVDWGVKYNVISKNQKDKQSNKLNFGGKADAELNLVVANLAAKGSFDSKNNELILNNTEEFSLVVEGSDFPIKSYSNLEQLWKAIDAIPGKISNDERGVPLEYDLLPLSIFYELYLNREYADKTMVDHIIEIVETVNNENQKLNKEWKHIQENQHLINCETYGSLREKVKESNKSFKDFRENTLAEYNNFKRNRDVKSWKKITHAIIETPKNSEIFEKFDKLFKSINRKKNSITVMKSCGIEYLKSTETIESILAANKDDIVCIYFADLGILIFFVIY